MRIDSSNFDKQLNATKSEVVNAQKVSIEKADMVKKAQNKEENVSFPGEQKLIEAIEKANQGLMGINTSLEFRIHERTKQITVKIINNETKEIIKEIPSEKILDMVADMCERAGIFVDKRG